MPVLGDVMTEGTVAKWLQPNGALVAEGAPLYEVETDKVTLTVDAPLGGRLERIVAEGETVPVGAIVGRLLSEATAPEPTPVVAEVAEVRATPAARAAARRLGVDLRSISNGRRLREADVLAHAPTGGSTALSGRRRVIAERMRSSLAQSAQVTESMEVDLTDALRLREQLEQLVGIERRPTITDLVMRAVVLALREHPALNATYQNGELRAHSDVQMGIAVDAEDGLIVPVIRDAHTLDLLDLAARSRPLIERARAGKLLPGDVTGGTFTITSLGPLGVDFFTPIINPPQVAILGIGRVFSKLALNGRDVVERQYLYLNLSFDHQVVDGAPAARFLQRIKHVLELPAALVVRTDR